MKQKTAYRNLLAGLLFLIAIICLFLAAKNAPYMSFGLNTGVWKIFGVDYVVQIVLINVYYVLTFAWPLGAILSGVGCLIKKRMLILSGLSIAFLMEATHWIYQLTSAVSTALSEYGTNSASVWITNVSFLCRTMFWFFLIISLLQTEKRYTAISIALQISGELILPLISSITTNTISYFPEFIFSLNGVLIVAELGICFVIYVLEAKLSLSLPNAVCSRQNIRPDVAETLIRLKTLVDSGVITEEDFIKKKNSILQNDSTKEKYII